MIGDARNGNVEMPYCEESHMDSSGGLLRLSYR